MNEGYRRATGEWCVSVGSTTPTVHTVPLLIPSPLPDPLPYPPAPAERLNLSPNPGRNQCGR